MTDRRLRPDDIADVRFDDDGLVPVVAQHVDTGAVLMVAWANRQALEATLETGAVHFWSRSRGALWRKGESSGNTLALASLHADCDGDTLLALVRPAGPACHTGERTCFGEGAHPTPVSGGSASDGTTRTSVARGGAGSVLARLDRVLRSRADGRPDGSYTVHLLDDENLRLKKLGEESAELIAALARGDGARSVEEAADLLYHLLVALRAEGIGLDQLSAALDDRAQ